MQFSQLESMHNSPLKCSTNNEASPEKSHSSPKLQQNAYRNSDEKINGQSRASPSPTKGSGASASRLKYHAMSGSPDKISSLEENVRVEDPSYRSPPQKKYSSPQRATGSKRASPTKTSLPFGKPIEIIKSKSPTVRKLAFRISLSFARIRPS